MSIIQLLASGNYISVNKDLIRELGLDEAVLIGELASEYMYWQEKEQTENGYFYSTIENIEKNTGLSGHKQRKAIKTLEDNKLITIKLKGIPAKRYIKINEKQVVELFNNKMLKNLTTGCEKIKQLDVKKFNGNKNNNKNKNNINRDYSEEFLETFYN